MLRGFHLQSPTRRLQSAPITATTANTSRTVFARQPFAEHLRRRPTMAKLLPWLRSLFGRGRPRTHRRPLYSRLRIEALEERTTPAASLSFLIFSDGALLSTPGQTLTYNITIANN